MFSTPIQLVLLLVSLISVEGVFSIISSSVALSSYNTLDSSVAYDLRYSIFGGSV